MNFFEAQDNARRKTWQLAAMFAAAVVTLVVLTNVLVAITIGWGGTQLGMTFEEQLRSLPAATWIWVSLGVTGLVATASLYKYLSIRGGGRSIAEALGGRLISQTTQDNQQRQLLNVVEEMAIAAGVPVPPVYLVPEPSINAFAAGFSSEDAVIGINQGTLDALNRNELQGVVAHEFSHILHGDTRINLRLIAILHGILFIGMIGYGLLRIGGVSRKNGMPMVALGIGLLVIGYGGTFFGNLIKSAVSRQREYLADASAVQFTRDPGGIADALKKIGGHTSGSDMTQPAAEEASHMFFGAAAAKFARSVFATHPPLDQRIRAIEPNWNGQFVASGAPGGQAAAAVPGAAGFAGATSASVQPQEIVDQVGAPDTHNLDAARQLIADNDDALNAAAHDPFEARALAYCMLLDHDDTVRNKQLAWLREHAEPGVLPHIDRLIDRVQASDALHSLTLFEMAVPALKELSGSQFRRFKDNAARLITADGHVDVFEWVLHRLLVRHLHGHFEGPQPQHGNVRHVHKRADEAAQLLAMLASVGHHDLDDQLAAYASGMQQLDLEAPFKPQTHFNYERLNQTLARLRELRPLAKPALIKACAATLLAPTDAGAASPLAHAMLRGVAATLDCPLPAELASRKT